MAVETSVEELGRELGEAIRDLPEYEAFSEAKAAVEADEETQRQIREFEQLREEFAAAREVGEATQEDVEELRRAQERLHEEPTMAEFTEAKERLQSRLETINQAISDPLAVDFGGEAGGCCQD
jgi:cell fate (sporulation/competence/biofilm development) regulator YlbF (YheA/YmcA/DUF963 family)